MQCDIYHAPLLEGDLEFKRLWIENCTKGQNLTTLLLGVVVLCFILLLGIIYVHYHNGEIHSDDNTQN